MSDNEKMNTVAQVKGLAKWFKLTISLSVFDHEIIHWEYPPKNDAV